MKTLVGSDETLKGDTFGGLIVAGFRANDEERERLQNMGVDDSKNLTDGRILQLANDLKEFFSDNFLVIELNPKQYNNILSVEKLTLLMNRLHREVNEKLRVPNSKHVVDKYPGCSVGDIIETKAESKYVEVAAASIIAREVALKQFSALSKNAGFIVPKGSTHVTNGLNELKRRKLNPDEFVKMNFKNVQKFFK